MVHQCQHCELRFVSEAELTEHVGHDHSGDRSVYERFRYPAGHAGVAPLYRDMRETDDATTATDE